ncbi:hypothetical protein DIURU_002163 [Diutina rugosa]|uniref:BZIP domain-containing protein n=1 Tax=Diutina rugosa TaxID=5481 RepID=A0A642URQ7_DIURU|nr:uncharacterized protein DIURU_002163 [Diutina rugosa]KAA8903941.1 hypothetical protein DIURU_002163 [Diutina rugosa]
MSEVKRSISEVSPSGGPPDKKAHAKPGRKPIDTEPKSKRTAQNRAAQRAYRERKEKKMKDLEEKVKLLETENVRAATEGDFLRAQIEVLKSELARYRGNADFSDLNLPTSVGRLSHPQTGGYVPHFPEVSPIHLKNSQTSMSPQRNGSSISSSAKSDHLSLSESQRKSPDFTAEYSWQPEKDNALENLETDFFKMTPANNTANASSSLNLTTENLDVAANFDEQVNTFCTKLNEACGTKESPLPKDKQFEYSSPFSALVTPQEAEETSTEAFLAVSSGDPLSFLNDANFDMNLAFKDPVAPIPEFEKPVHDETFDLLTNQESIYDPLGSGTMETTPNSQTTPITIGSGATPGSNKEVNINFSFNEFVKSSISENSADEAMVPASPKRMQCSEIWERITSHPKYSELDIDGLCSELKAKAKCSEKGVVVNQNDVNYFIEQSAMRRGL